MTIYAGMGVTGSICRPPVGDGGFPCHVFYRDVMRKEM